MYDFDAIIERKGTSSLKYDFSQTFGIPTDAHPLWVADMDFRTPPAVVDALQQTIDHGIFGYTLPDEAYREAVFRWFATRFHWQPAESSMLVMPSVLFAISTAISALTSPGDGVLIQEPVYQSFAKLIKSLGRKVVVNTLLSNEGHYTMDFSAMEHSFANENVKLFLLCSPHNPVGRVWTKDELQTAANLCEKYNVLIASDEIHADFTYPGYKHTIFSQLDGYAEANSVICLAPTKTFNLAGLQSANIFIADPAIRTRFRREADKSGLGSPGRMALEAARAAYNQGGEWLDALLVYLEDNLSLLEEALKGKVPFRKPEGTYLAWLDFREIESDPDKLEKFLLHKAGLWLNQGKIFGKSGAGFARMNVALPRNELQSALDKLTAALP